MAIGFACCCTGTCFLPGCPSTALPATLHFTITSSGFSYPAGTMAFDAVNRWWVGCVVNSGGIPVRVYLRCDGTMSAYYKGAIVGGLIVSQQGTCADATNFATGCPEIDWRQTALSCAPYSQTWRYTVVSSPWPQNCTNVIQSGDTLTISL